MIIFQLYSDIKLIHVTLDGALKERNEAIEKYEKNDKYWKGRYDKLETENN